MGRRTIRKISILVTLLLLAGAVTTAIVYFKDDIAGLFADNDIIDAKDASLRYVDTNGETKIINVKSGEPYSMTVPQKEGYTFKGLFDQESGGVQYIGSNGLSKSNWSETADRNLFAQWTPKNITLHFEYEGGEALEERRVVQYDSTIESLPVPAKAGHTFLGWYDSTESGAVSYSSNTGRPVKSTVTYTNYPIDKEIGEFTLYAKWETILVPVTFVANKATINPVVYSSDKAQTVVNIPWGSAIDAYVPSTGDFSPFETQSNGVRGIRHWSESGSANSGAFSGTITGEKILYAQWAPAIIFDMQSGTVKAPIITNAGSALSISLPQRDGYSFKGWVDKDGNVFKENSMPANGAIISPDWGLIIYTISYVYNGGSTISGLPTEYSAASTNFVIPTNTKRQYYEFGGWYDNSSFTGNPITNIGSGSGLYRNLTLYAKWTPISYSITYDFNGGSDNGKNPNLYTIETSTFTLIAPMRSGYEFVGWGGTSISATATIVLIEKGSTGNLKYKAYWTKTFTVSMQSKNCALDNGFNYDVSDGNSQLKEIHSIELGNLILTNCSDLSKGYSVAPGKIPFIEFQLLHNHQKLPQKPGHPSELFSLSDDNWAGNVKGTNISGKKIGLGAYYVKVTYTDNTISQKNATNFLNNVSNGSKIALVSASDININKTVKSIDVVVVYELYRGSPGFLGIWWHEHTNWYCTYTFNFS